MANGNIIGSGMVDPEEEVRPPTISTGFDESGFKGLTVRPGENAASSAIALLNSQRKPKPTLGTGGITDATLAASAERKADTLSLGQQAVNRLDSGTLGGGPVNAMGKPSLIGQDLSRMRSKIAKGKEVRETIGDLSSFEQDFDAESALQEGLVKGQDRRTLFAALQSKDTAKQRQAQNILGRLNKERRKQFGEKKKQEAIAEQAAARQQQVDIDLANETRREVMKGAVKSSFDEDAEDRKMAQDQFNRVADTTELLAQEQRDNDEWDRRLREAGNDPESKKIVQQQRDQEWWDRFNATNDERTKQVMISERLKRQAADRESDELSPAKTEAENLNRQQQRKQRDAKETGTPRTTEQQIGLYNQAKEKLDAIKRGDIKADPATVKALENRVRRIEKTL